MENQSPLIWSKVTRYDNELLLIQQTLSLSICKTKLNVLYIIIRNNRNQKLKSQPLRDAKMQYIAIKRQYNETGRGKQKKNISTTQSYAFLLGLSFKDFSCEWLDNIFSYDVNSDKTEKGKSLFGWTGGVAPWKWLFTSVYVPPRSDTISYLPFLFYSPVHITFSVLCPTCSPVLNVKFKLCPHRQEKRKPWWVNSDSFMSVLAIIQSNFICTAPLIQLRAVQSASQMTEDRTSVDQ